MAATVPAHMPSHEGASLPRDGFVEERRFRKLLESSGQLDVRYDEVLDRDFAVDAVVTVRNAPWLNPVGIQFTLCWNYAKRRRALNCFRRTRIVPRFLYLRSRAPLTREALGPLMRLILDCAESDEVHGIATAALRLDTSGRHVVDAIHHYPLIRHHHDEGGIGQ
jgi:hypothetical protein